MKQQSPLATMHSSASSAASCTQWRPPPSRCLSAANVAASRGARLLRQHQGRRLLAAAAAASGAGEQEQEEAVFRIPGSRDEAVRTVAQPTALHVSRRATECACIDVQVDVSVAALLSQIKPLLGSKSKKSKKASGACTLAADRLRDTH